MTKKRPPLLPPLTASQERLLANIAQAFRADVETIVEPNSDLATPDFIEDFTNRLLLYHALNAEPLKKKTFEYAFAASCRSAGKHAVVNVNSTHAGHDVDVDGVAFSCKTEASTGISRSAIVISKLMEARWIRECASSADFAAQVRNRIVHHLQSYQRMIMLRAFIHHGTAFAYELVEIPVRVLLAMSTLPDAAFSPRTRNGGSSAKVMLNQRPAFTLRLDGSVEKVTISGLKISLCRQHARWIIPIGEGVD